MGVIKVYVETGKKKSFAGAVEWPGWCRSGRDEETALQALVDYGSRYAQVLQREKIEFHPPTKPSGLLVTERLGGDATTDFGAPATIPDTDRKPINHGELERLQAVLQACWGAFDDAVERATGRVLRKGPRGGGRDLEKMVDHVIDGDKGYLSRLAWRYKREKDLSPVEELSRTREAIFNALNVAVNEGLPERGPRGGIIWPPRYFVRRVAWHVLDHAWEIEDRIE